MSNIELFQDRAITQIDAGAIERALIDGDLKTLTVEQRVSYYFKRCQSLGLDPLSKPFDYIVYQGKMVLYPNKNCAEQLRRLNSISIKISSKDKIGDVFSITVSAKNNQGREDEATAFLDITGLAGQALANALMKVETKAKRRVTLSICGLGMNDETEWESVDSAIPVNVDFDQTDVINKNVEAAKEVEHKERIKNEAYIKKEDWDTLAMAACKFELKQGDIKSIIGTLWGLESLKDMRVWQCEDLLKMISDSKTREELDTKITQIVEKK